MAAEGISFLGSFDGASNPEGATYMFGNAHALANHNIETVLHAHLNETTNEIDTFECDKAGWGPVYVGG